MYPEHCSREAIHAHMAQYVAAIAEAKKRLCIEEPLVLHPFREGSNFVARIDMPFLLDEQQFAQLKAQYVPMPSLARLYKLIERWNQQFPGNGAFTKRLRARIKPLLAYSRRPTKNGLHAVLQEMEEMVVDEEEKEQGVDLFFGKVCELIKQEKMTIAYEGLVFTDGKISSLDIQLRNNGPSVAAHLRKWDKEGISFAFKLAQENVRELLAYELAKPLQLDQFLLPKARVELMGVSLAGAKDPVGLACGWIDHRSSRRFASQLGKVTKRKHCPVTTKLWANCDRFSYEGNLLLDLVFGSYDSHMSQYLLAGKKLYNVDFSRYGIPGDAYVEQSTYATFCSALLDTPVLSQHLCEASKQLILSWDIAAWEKHLLRYAGHKRVYSAVTEKAATLRFEWARIGRCKDRSLLLEQYTQVFSESGMSLTTEELQKALLRHYAKKARLLKQKAFKFLHPGCVQKMVARARSLQKMVQGEPTFMELFQALYPDLSIFLELVKDLYPFAGLRLAFHSKPGGSLERTSLEEIVYEYTVRLGRLERGDELREKLSQVRQEAIAHATMASICGSFI